MNFMQKGRSTPRIKNDLIIEAMSRNMTPYSFYSLSALFLGRITRVGWPGRGRIEVLVGLYT